MYSVRILYNAHVLITQVLFHNTDIATILKSPKEYVISINTGHR
jgi:hypothetical protein